jgi:SAM-dependent methyltransferase
MPVPGRFAAMHVEMARAKPRRIWQSASFRLYYAGRRYIKGPRLLRFLLNASWLFRRFAYEETGLVYGQDILRPHTRPLVAGAVGQGDSVIDFGCGTGEVPEYVAPIAGTVVAIDHNAGAVATTRERCARFSNVTVVEGDWSDSLSGREPADVGLLLHVLEHLDAPEATLRQLREWCNTLVIEVPDFPAEPLNSVRAKLGTAFWNDVDHVTEFDRDLLRDVLTRAGWTVERLDSLNGCLVAVAN